MEATEFIERATKAFKAGCPGLTDEEAQDDAIALWEKGSVLKELDTVTPEDMAYEEMSYWDDDENT